MRHARGQVHMGSLRLVLGLLCIVVCLMGAASAELTRFPDPSRPVSLTVRCSSEAPYLDGLEFKIFKVANIDDEVQFAPLPPFDGYSIDIRHDTSAEEWAAMTNTLASYVLADGIAPLKTGVTMGGKLTFDGLTSGLYLVTGPSIPQNGRRYTTQPALVVLPNRQSDGWWNYDVDIYPKWEIVEIVYRDLDVIKLWDDNDVDSRPWGVQVELYCDDELYDTVTLGKWNNWYHRWKNLDSMYTWTVVERNVPDGYYVTIRQQENGTIAVTNRRPDPPDDPDEPNIPQTGVDWTPVMVLALTGMALFYLGWVRMRRSLAETD